MLMTGFRGSLRLRLVTRLIGCHQPSSRPFHQSIYPSRDSLARYSRPSPPKSAGNARNDEFETASTTPVAASLQEVPPPGNDAGSKVIEPLPAMKHTPFATAETSALPPRPPGDAAVVVLGITIPAKPVPPGEEECCMSGCVHCVYTIYADDLEKYTTALGLAKEALLKAGTPQSEWPQGVLSLMEGSAGDASVMKGKEAAQAVDGVDPSMAAFLAYVLTLISAHKQEPRLSPACVYLSLR